MLYTTLQNLFRKYYDPSNPTDKLIFRLWRDPRSKGHLTWGVIPIEAVVAVVECKSLSPDREELIPWCDSIKKLNSNPTGVGRVIQGLAVGVTNKTQLKTGPLKILVALKDTGTDKLENDLNGHFDIIIRPRKNDTPDGFSLTIFNEDKTLGWWVKRLNCPEENPVDDVVVEKLTKELMTSFDPTGILEVENRNDGNFQLKNTLKELRIGDNTILSLTFQLNQLLMLINNPMMFPHFAYARVFKETIGDREG